MMRTTILLCLTALWAGAQCYDFPIFQGANATKTGRDPSDFSWVKRWAAVGDSYTAGIGSGAPLGNYLTEQPGETDWYCARYDTSYPVIVNNALGPSVENFQFEACSGDRTGGVYNQIKALSGNLDLVMLTAGGNDLCLGKLLEKCVFLPTGDTTCDSVLTIAQNNLNSILEGNLKSLMEALNPMMNDDGIVVINGYAQFFNTDNEDCATKQDWEFVNLWPLNSGLTIARRKQFNDLVVQINTLIQEVVDDTAANTDYKWKIAFSNWDSWVYDGVSGQMCDPASTGVYPDPAQPDLQFFKPDTNIDESAHDSLKRRRDVPMAVHEENAAIWEEARKREFEAELYKSVLFNSVNERAAVKHRLDRRSPAPPSCPGDEPDVDVQPPSVGLPNSVAKNFHPNELGHYTIASWALQTVVDARAEVLGVSAPECPAPAAIDKFTCWQGTGSQSYATNDELNKNYVDFCDAVTRPTGKMGWSFTKTYNKGTPDETEFLISLSDTSTLFDKTECVESMGRIINGCDGNDPKNPMDWKFGGEWVRGDYTFQVNPAGTRPWPVIQSPGGTCKGWYHGIYSSYTIEGYGFSDHDHGQDTLLSKAKSCVGGGITSWNFDYYDTPTKDGYEWKATFSTPIWVRARCFKNNKVQFGAGGFTDGCGGND